MRKWIALAVAILALATIAAAIAKPTVYHWTGKGSYNVIEPSCQGWCNGHFWQHESDYALNAECDCDPDKKLRKTLRLPFIGVGDVRDCTTYPICFP